MKDQGWKNLFKHKILAPLTIGAIILLISSAFDMQELGWVGVGVACVGWYFLIRND